MKQKSFNLSEETRSQIAETLPMAMKKAIDAYQDFIDGKSEDTNSSNYKNKQTAAKAGLGHIELLMKLASMVDGLDEDQENDLMSLLQGAKKELEGQNE